jgi:hypothetical protein
MTDIYSASRFSNVNSYKLIDQYTYLSNCTALRPIKINPESFSLDLQNQIFMNTVSSYGIKRADGRTPASPSLHVSLPVLYSLQELYICLGFR